MELTPFPPLLPTPPVLACLNAAITPGGLMQAALFSPIRYHGPTDGSGWPIPGTTYSSEAAEKSMRSSIAQFRLADEVGFDWVTVAEHHYAPFSLNPNPMVTAGALTQIVRRAKIALLGSTIPILNPV